MPLVANQKPNSQETEALGRRLKELKKKKSEIISPDFLGARPQNKEQGNLFHIC